MNDPIPLDPDEPLDPEGPIDPDAPLDPEGPPAVVPPIPQKRPERKKPEAAVPEASVSGAGVGPGFTLADAYDEDEPVVPRARSAPEEAPGYLPRIQYEGTEEEAESAGSGGGEAKGAGGGRVRGERARERRTEGGTGERRERTGGGASRGEGGSDGGRKSEARPSRREVERGTEKAIVEETPELDTYDARQKVRRLIGIGAGVILALALLFIFRPFGGGGGVEVAGELPPDDTSLTSQARESGEFAQGKPAVKAVAQGEAAAQALLADAQGLAKQGNMELALGRLGRILEAFPGTQASVEAQAAIERRKQGQALFPEAGRTEVAKGGVAAGSEPAASVAAEPAKAPAAPEVVSAMPSEPVVPPVEPRLDPGSLLARGDAARVIVRGLPAGFRARPESGVYETGWPLEITCDRDGSSMVLVPGGQYEIGRAGGAPEEGPPHRVWLSTFYVDVHEVSSGQYRKYLSGRPSEATVGDDRMPVVGVTQTEALEFAGWSGKQLPTEAQWEAAARTWDGRLYPWGVEAAAQSRAGDGKLVVPIATTPGDLSPVGAFDLAGNAWEWTRDRFSTRYHETHASQVAVDPQGPDRTRSRTVEMTVKGGAKDWQVAWRAGLKPESRLPYLGFRCVLQVESGPPAGMVPTGSGVPGRGGPAEKKGQPGGVVPF